LKTAKDNRQTTSVNGLRQRFAPLTRTSLTSDLCDLPGNAAAPALNDPVGVLADPLGHFELPKCHALLVRDFLGFKIEMDVFALGWLIYQTDSNNKLDHS
jgi:hypothetical protein